MLFQQPRGAPHQLVAAREIDLAGLSQPLLLPLLVAGHHRVDLGDRHLHGQHPDDVGGRADRGHHPGRGDVQGREIALEVGGHDLVQGAVAQHLLVALGQRRGRVRLLPQVDAEVDALVRRVGDVAVPIDDQGVLVAEGVDQTGEVRPVLGVGLAPGAAVARVGERQPGVEVLIGPTGGVVALDVPPRGRGGDEGVGGVVEPRALLQLRHEVGLVELGQLGGLGGSEGAGLQLVEPADECPGPLHRTGVPGVQHHTLLEAGELPLDRAGTQLTDRGQLLERRVAQRVPAVDVADHRDHDRREQTDRQQHDQQLGLDRQAEAPTTSLPSTLGRIKGSRRGRAVGFRLGARR